MKLPHFSLLTLIAIVLLHCCAGDSLSRQWTSYNPTKVASSRDSYVKAAEHSTSLKDTNTDASSGSSFYQNGNSHPSSGFYYHLYPNSQAKYYGYSGKLA